MLKRIPVLLFFCLYTLNIELSASQKLYYTWEQVHEGVAKLHRLYIDKGVKPKGILIITRGGLIPGGMLSSLSHIKNIRVIALESYEKMQRGSLRLIHKPNIPNKGQGWLVIDDIVDTGATTKFVKKLFPKAHYLSLVVKPQGEHLVHDYSYKVSQDTWVVFPWEVAE